MSSGFGFLNSRWRVLLGAVPIQACLGAVYAWSVFRLPLQQKFGWSSTQATLPFQIILLVFALTMVLGGLWQDRVGPRIVASVGGLFLGLGLFLASKSASLAFLVLSYGLLGGIGIGLAYGCPISVGLKWFPDRRGLITGLIVASFGAGAMIFAPLARGLIDSVGPLQTFAVLAAIFSIGVIGGSQFLKNPPSGYAVASVAKAHASVKAASDYSWGQMVRTGQFYLMLLLYCLGCAAGFVVIAHAAPMAQVNIDSLRQMIASGDPAKAKALAASAVGILAISNALGRILWGFLSDRLGSSKTLAAVFLVCSFGLFMVNSVHGYSSFIAAICIVGACFGGYLALFPAITAEFYGTKRIGLNYGSVFVAYGLGAVLGPWVSARAFDTYKTYQSALLGAAAVCLICAFVALILRPPKTESA
jgi:OFA family oxalate/formate antiporter-like MFS transporter